MQFFYAASILFVLTLSLSRAAITLLLKNVEPQAPVLVGCNILLALIAIHTIGVTLSLGFQCTSPSPWVYFPGQCINSVSASNFSLLTLTYFSIGDLVLCNDSHKHRHRPCHHPFGNYHDVDASSPS